MYHSASALTVNATVMMFGGEYIIVFDPPEKQNNSAQEYFPPYLQIADSRPVVHGIPSLPPNQMIHNSTTVVNVGVSSDIEYLSLVKLSSTTHGLDTTQRFIKLTESAPKTATQMFVHTPKDGGIAPAGKYMLFGVSYQGIPSVAKYVTIL